MNSANEILKKADELIARSRRFSEKLDKLNAEVKSKDQKIEAQRNELTTCYERISLLEQEVTSLKLGTFINLTDENKKEVHRKINDYIKELSTVIQKLEGEG